MSNPSAQELLAKHSLRATTPRLAVLQVLINAKTPLSHTEVLEHLGETDWDPATVYRNLVKLRDAGVATIVSHAKGIARYALIRKEDDNHRHPHFLCDDCGRVACLPAELVPSISMKGPWSSSIKRAVLQLRGECPDCLSRDDKTK